MVHGMETPTHYDQYPQWHLPLRFHQIQVMEEKVMKTLIYVFPFDILICGKLIF